MVMTETRWFTVEQVAERVQVTPATVRQWLREGKIKGRNLGNKAGWRVADDDLERFMRGDEPAHD